MDKTHPQVHPALGRALTSIYLGGQLGVRGMESEAEKVTPRLDCEVWDSPAKELGVRL